MSYLSYVQCFQSAFNKKDATSPAVCQMFSYNTYKYTMQSNETFSEWIFDNDLYFRAVFVYSFNTNIWNVNVQIRLENKSANDLRLVRIRNIKYWNWLVDDVLCIGSNLCVFFFSLIREAENQLKFVWILMYRMRVVYKLSVTFFESKRNRIGVTKWVLVWSN